MYLIINKSLQNLSCTFSRHWIFLLKPHISEPYSIIVFIILLKSSSWHSIDKLCVLPLFKPESETPRNYNLQFYLLCLVKVFFQLPISITIMSGNCVPLNVDLFIYSYEAYFMHGFLN